MLDPENLSYPSEHHSLVHYAHIPTPSPSGNPQGISLQLGGSTGTFSGLWGSLSACTELVTCTYPDTHLFTCLPLPNHKPTWDARLTPHRTVPGKGLGGDRTRLSNCCSTCDNCLAPDTGNRHNPLDCCPAIPLQPTMRPTVGATLPQHQPQSSQFGLFRISFPMPPYNPDKDHQAFPQTATITCLAHGQHSPATELDCPQVAARTVYPLSRLAASNWLTLPPL